MCCPTPPISPQQCRSGPVINTQYVQSIHRNCPTAYSYAYDDEAGLHNCPGIYFFSIGRLLEYGHRGESAPQAPSAWRLTQFKNNFRWDKLWRYPVSWFWGTTPLYGMGLEILWWVRYRRPRPLSGERWTSKRMSGHLSRSSRCVSTLLWPKSNRNWHILTYPSLFNHSLPTLACRNLA